MVESKKLLKELFREARFFDARDLLVNPLRNPSKVISFSPDQINLPFEGKLKSIVRESKAIKKESGNDALCITHDLVGSAGTPLFPLFLETCPFTINKITHELLLHRTHDWSLNPYLSVFLEQLDIKLSPTLESFLFETNLEHDVQDEIRAEIQKMGLYFEGGLSYLGNFHPHRFSHLKDLDLLIQGNSFSNALLQLSGDDYSEGPLLELPSSFLFQSDVDQRQAIELSTKYNLALLGPPGTGKSQYLTDLLAKLVFANKSTLVLSEKRTALEVIQKRLKEHNLEHLSAIQTTQGSSSDFIRQLKENWKQLESDSKPKVLTASRYSSLASNLQFYLDVLNQANTIGGLSLNEFLKYCPNPEERGQFFLNPPHVLELADQESALDEFYRLKGHQLLSTIEVSALRSEGSTNLLDNLRSIQVRIEEITARFGEQTSADLDSLIQRAAWSQVAQSEYFRKHRDLFAPESKQQKQILQNIKKWRKTQAELLLLEVQNHWKRTCHSEELIALQQRLKNKRRLLSSPKKEWRKFSTAAFETADALIAQQLRIYEVQKKLNHIENQIQSVGLEADVSAIILFEQWLKRFNTAEWREIQLLSTQLIDGDSNIHDDLHRTKKWLDQYFKASTLPEIVQQIDLILQSKSSFLALIQLTKNWSRELLHVAISSSSFDELKKNSYHSHWLLFCEQFPGMSSFKAAMLRDKLIALQTESENESEFFADSIRLNQHTKFQQFETLLRTPAAKLSEEEKELKTSLRRGKSILAKEFAKKTRHLSLHELYKSEARNWIQVLIPIMLCNTEQVARAFPLELDLFDVGIFDEASQVPLYTAVGAAQRCKKLVVAGDDQQMRPSRPFGSGKDDIQDLLSQALMYFKSSTLKHHYRSKHEDLIAFSNRHFYNNELIAFPSFNREKQAIQFIHCNGEYKERKNEQEAQAIVNEITRLLQKEANFGVVAFSEEQIGLIWSLLSPKLAETLQDAIDEDRAFVKAVDKVQGDECDHLLISFTFGFNPNGQFKYTFGPMSTVHGTNRLNVLLTRSRKTIQFYASVSYADFRVSPNPSIELIRKYFAFLESDAKETSIRFPFGLQPEIEHNKLRFQHIGSSIQDAHELATLFNVLENRGWEVHFV